MEFLRSWLYLVASGCVIFGAPILLLCWLLHYIFKSWLIRLPMALLIWGIVILPVSTSTLPEWRVCEIHSFRGLRSIYPAIESCKKAHGDTYPDRLSDLLPEYVAVENTGWFFGRTLGRASEEERIAVNGDFTAIDRQSLFIYLSGTAGMLAANRTPIVPKRFGTTWFQKPFRVVLYTDGRVKSLPEKEYQQQITQTASGQK